MKNNNKQQTALSFAPSMVRHAKIQAVEEILSFAYLAKKSLINCLPKKWQ